MSPRRPRLDYASDIPAEATEHETSPYRRKGHHIYLRTVEYRLGADVVGVRQFDADGSIALEVPRRDGRVHGRAYEFHPSGVVSALERYAQGRLHGTCFQWDEEGRLLGRYVLRNGTGLDVWRCRGPTGRVQTSEVRTLQDGLRHGFEWWLRGRRLSSEAHFVAGKLHGIERSWTVKGKLEPGYPRYWVDDARVTKRQYLAAARRDRSLPPFRERDNRGGRSLPASVRKEIGRYTA
jgi:hypothetical protein